VCENGSLRIAIDAIPLLVRSAGVKNFLFYWISHLRRLLGDRQVSLFPFLDRLPDLDHEGSIASPAGYHHPPGPALRAEPLAQPPWDLIGPRTDYLPHHQNAEPAPPAATHRPPARPDLLALSRIPPARQRGRREALRRAHLETRCRSHRRLGKHPPRCVRILGLNPDIIRVIYPGVPQPFFEATAENAAATCRKYGLTRPYALYVGTVEPRKNLDRLLDSWQDLPASVRDSFDLIAIGPEGWQSAQTMARLRHPPRACAACAIWAMSRSPTCPRSPPAPPSFFIPRSMRASAFPSPKPWRRACP